MMYCKYRRHLSFDILLFLAICIGGNTPLWAQSRLDSIQQLDEVVGHRQVVQGSYPCAENGQAHSTVAEQFLRGRCHPLLLGYPNQGLRRNRWTKNCEHPQPGYPPCGNFL